MSDESDDDDDDGLHGPGGLRGSFSMSGAAGASDESASDDLARIAAYLSQHNFIDNGGADLDVLSEQQLAAIDAATDEDDDSDDDETLADHSASAPARAAVADEWSASFDDGFEDDSAFDLPPPKAGAEGSGTITDPSVDLSLTQVRADVTYVTNVTQVRADAPRDRQRVMADTPREPPNASWPFVTLRPRDRHALLTVTPP